MLKLFMIGNQNKKNQPGGLFSRPVGWNVYVCGALTAGIG